MASHATRLALQLAETTAQNVSGPKLGDASLAPHTCAAARADAKMPLRPVPAKYAEVYADLNRDM
jgi:hypothetical protein|tara:strand:+ start:264 stop:458 length:195 start_codon:yes stop_codon:yes gene_type:complete